MFWIDKKGCNFLDFLTVAGLCGREPVSGCPALHSAKIRNKCENLPSTMLKFVKVFVLFDAWH